LSLATNLFNILGCVWERITNPMLVISMLDLQRSSSV
jgi:hypothetical protein